MTELDPNKRLRLSHTIIDTAFAKDHNDLEQISLWDVNFSTDTLLHFTNIRSLHIYGCSITSLHMLADLPHLYDLKIDQPRGLENIDFLNGVKSLRSVSLYGLRNLRTSPSLKSNHHLTTVELGELPLVDGLCPYLDAPQLRQLRLHRRVNVLEGDIPLINQHPKLASFSWDTYGRHDEYRNYVIKKAGKTNWHSTGSS